MNRIKENLLVFLIGAVGYPSIELLWRGYSHWTMAIVGGLCFLLLYHLGIEMSGKALWKKCLLGAILVTVIEFISGCIINIIFNLNVWDYSNTMFNVMGQICLEFTAMWFLLCIPVLYLGSYIYRQFHHLKLAKVKKVSS